MTVTTHTPMSGPTMGQKPSTDRSGRILRMRDVIQSVGLSESTIGRLYRAGEFPRKIRLSARTIGWREADIEAWKASRPPPE